MDRDIFVIIEKSIVQTENVFHIVYVMYVREQVLLLLIRKWAWCDGIRLIQTIFLKLSFENHWLLAQYLHMYTHTRTHHTVVCKTVTHFWPSHANNQLEHLNVISTIQTILKTL